MGTSPTAKYWVIGRNTVYVLEQVPVTSTFLTSSIGFQHNDLDTSQAKAFPTYDDDPTSRRACSVGV